MSKTQIEVLPLDKDSVMKLFEFDIIRYVPCQDGGVVAQGINKGYGHLFSVKGDSQKHIEEYHSKALAEENASKKVPQLRVV